MFSWRLLKAIIIECVAYAVNFDVVRYLTVLKDLAIVFSMFLYIAPVLYVDYLLVIHYVILP